MRFYTFSFVTIVLYRYSTHYFMDILSALNYYVVGISPCANNRNICCKIGGVLITLSYYYLDVTVSVYLRIVQFDYTDNSMYLFTAVYSRSE